MDVPGRPWSRAPLFTALLSQVGPFINIRTLFTSRVIFTAVGQFLSGKVKLVPDGAPEKSEVHMLVRICGSSAEPAACPGCWFMLDFRRLNSH